MKQLFTIIFCAFAIGLFSQTSPKIFKSYEMKNNSFAGKTVAILPVFADYQDLKLIPGRSHIAEDQSGIFEMLNQREMQAWLRKQNYKGKFSMEVQDVFVTNKILKENEINSDEELAKYDVSQLSEMLGVDAIILCNIYNTSTRNDVTAVAAFVFAQQNIPTGYAGISVAMFDGTSQEVVYSYDRFMRSYLNRPLERTTAILVRKASKRMKFKL